jgi:hypothetical protein
MDTTYITFLVMDMLRNKMYIPITPMGIYAKKLQLILMYSLPMGITANFFVVMDTTDKDINHFGQFKDQNVQVHDLGM